MFTGLSPILFILLIICVLTHCFLPTFSYSLHPPRFFLCTASVTTPSHPHGAFTRCIIHSSHNVTPLAVSSSSLRRPTRCCSPLVPHHCSSHAFSARCLRSLRSRTASSHPTRPCYILCHVQEIVENPMERKQSDVNEKRTLRSTSAIGNGLITTPTPATSVFTLIDRHPPVN